MSLAEFLRMGGYAFYVWTAYGVCAVVLIVNLVLPVLQLNRFFRELALKQKRRK